MCKESCSFVGGFEVFHLIKYSIPGRTQIPSSHKTSYSPGCVFYFFNQFGIKYVCSGKISSRLSLASCVSNLFEMTSIPGNVSDAKKIGSPCVQGQVPPQTLLYFPQLHPSQNRVKYTISL